MRKIIILVLLYSILLVMPNFLGNPEFNKEGWNDSQIVSTESDNNAYRAILSVDIYEIVHIAWRDKTNYKDSGNDWDIFYKYKPKNGNWTTTEIVSTESTEDSNCLSMIVDENGNVHVAWKDETNYMDSGNDFDIFYKMKPKNGNWTTTEIISTESSSDCGCPALAVDLFNNIHVVWPDQTDYSNSGNDFDIFYKMKPTQGSWTKTEVVTTEGSGNSLKSSIIVDQDENIHVIWEEETDIVDSGDDFDIFYKMKPKNGNWTTTELVSTESTDDSLSPSNLIIDKLGTLHLTWVDKTNYLNSGNDFDIFYKMKEKDGNWTTSELVSTNSNYNSYFTSIGIDINGIIHVSWWDGTPTKWVVYYNYKKPNIDQVIPGDKDPPISNDDKSNDTTGFSLLLIFFTLFFTIFIKRKRLKK